jgi:8-oxo-dGTP pyrophosphatase MutT (NUDIX family)
VIFNENNEFLLVEKNASQSIAPGKAMFPGWTVEFWENIEDTLHREVEEEVWLSIISSELLMLQTLILWDTHWLWAYYICKTKDMNWRNVEPEKHSRVFWGSKEFLDWYGEEVFEQLKKKWWIK